MPDCEVFLTADKNFVRVLDRIGEQAPVPVGRAYRVAPAAHDGIVEAIEASLRTL
jgi:gamma-glutamyl-gamma-aminobutyrate hydrolase PuuD